VDGFDIDAIGGRIGWSYHNFWTRGTWPPTGLTVETVTISDPLESVGVTTHSWDNTSLVAIKGISVAELGVNP
jgi:hypothetical protein